MERLYKREAIENGLSVMVVGLQRRNLPIALRHSRNAGETQPLLQSAAADFVYVAANSIRQGF